MSNRAKLKQTELDFDSKSESQMTAKPATEIMKKVAIRSNNFKDMKRVFSEREMQEIISVCTSSTSLSVPSTLHATTVAVATITLLGVYMVPSSPSFDMKI